MIITLEVTSGQRQTLGVSAQMSFDHNGGSFGRASHNAWVLPDESKTVSGQHGMVYFESGKFYLTDISTNGIFVNGSDVALGKGNTAALTDGDLLRFGEYQVKVSGPVAETGKLPDQQPVAAGHSLFEPMATASPSKPAQSQPQSASFDETPNAIESPNFDPLAATPDSSASAGGSVGAGGPTGSTQSSTNPFASNSQVERPAVADTGYQHSSPMNDPFTNSEVTSDPDLSAPSGQQQGSEIPEDWDLTGFSKALGKDRPAAEPAPKHTNFIPEDVPLFDEPGPAAPPSAPKSPHQPSAQTIPPGALQEEGRKIPEPPVSPALGQSAASQSPIKQAANPSQGQSGSNDASYQAFMQGLGLQLSSLNPNQDPLQVMTTTGRLFREVIQGLMILLQARSELKSQFRMSATTIRPTENNPLKFSPNVDEALKALFADERSGYLRSDAALEEGIRDIRNHQMAMIAGMQSAFTALLQRLDPEQFSTEGKKVGSSKVSLLSGGKKSRAWDQYCDYYDNVVVKSGNAFQMLFGEDFNSAYEEQLRLLESSKD